jgi:RimJ/RimL family protein N-acetyltransferase
VQECSSAQLIGLAWLLADGSAAEVELGLLVEQQRRGYGSQVLRALVRHAFEILGLEELHAAPIAGHVPSLRLLEHVGFTPASELGREGRSGYRLRAVPRSRFLQVLFPSRPRTSVGAVPSRSCCGRSTCSRPAC